VKLWDLRGGTEAATAVVRGEVHGCLFLLDGQSLVAVDNHGRLTLHEVPSLAVQAEVATRAAVQSCDLAPSGGQIALACGDGRVRFIAVEGFDDGPLLAGTTRTTRRVASLLQKLFGQSRLVYCYQCTCPACRHTFDVANGEAGADLHCPKCRRHLRLSGVTRIASEKESAR
jgi:hypothetical protein